MKIFYFQSIQYKQREQKLDNNIEILRQKLLKFEKSSMNNSIVVEDRDKYDKSIENQLTKLEKSIDEQNQIIEKLNINVEQIKQTLGPDIQIIKYQYNEIEKFIINFNMFYLQKCQMLLTGK